MTKSDFKFQSATINPKESIKAGFDLKTGEWEATQNIQQYKEQAKLDRDRQDYFGKANKGYRKMATIPDIVAIKINEDHGIDLHDPAFMHDKDKMIKLKHILRFEYPDLLINT